MNTPSQTWKVDFAQVYPTPAPPITLKTTIDFHPKAEHFPPYDFTVVVTQRQPSCSLMQMLCQNHQLSLDIKFLLSEIDQQ